MNASLNIAGQWPAEGDLLNSSAMNGATRSIICFSTEVGIGSAADDLSGRRQTALMMSSVVRDRSSVSGCAELYVGGGRR